MKELSAIRVSTQHSEIRQSNQIQLEISDTSYSTKSFVQDNNKLKVLLHCCGIQIFNIGPNLRTFIPCFVIAVFINIAMIVISFYSNMPRFLKIMLYILNGSQNIFYILTTIINPGVPRRNERQKWDQQLIQCTKCNLFRRRSTKHCNQCGVCISRYDHHCMFVTKCIGKYNMIPFVLFVITTMTGFMFNFVFILGTLSMMSSI